MESGESEAAREAAREVAHEEVREVAREEVREEVRGGRTKAIHKEVGFLHDASCLH